ncbi:unnamed protein product [Hymenolepis diminuta]|uniref:Uncharacterized protein n=1 Tax=Hymenolepis diminuta TaxID=6216 RepID=A0A564XXZ8_HYMDI|nr:unnamed protein product [Hymenolepis diminuta]
MTLVNWSEQHCTGLDWTVLERACAPGRCDVGVDAGVRSGGGVGVCSCEL